MIGRIRGELLEVVGSIAVVEACGVGYEVQIPESALFRLPAPGEVVDLRIRQVVREDSLALYGFFDEHERRLFDLLTDVNGCGPRIALSLIGSLGEDAARGAILRQDAKSLTRAQGVGPKLAERIILELKEKIAEESLHRRVEQSLASSTGTPREKPDEIVEALVALGYRRPEAQVAATNAREEAESVEDQIKSALRSLAR
jgi:Holliday junction DNA helicase RuvA